VERLSDHLANNDLFSNFRFVLSNDQRAIAQSEAFAWKLAIATSSAA
jgi:hypothetical protein